MIFSKKAVKAPVERKEDTKEVKGEFIRDESDNKLFPSIQVKNIQDIITEDCVGAWDFDGVIWKACANMENKLVKITNTDLGVEEVLPNVTTFKGRGKKVSDSSWLGLYNIDRELAGLEPLTPEDFTVEPFQELKMEKEKAIEQVKIQVFQKIKQVKQQYRIPNVKLVVGQGECFRATLDQVRKYKGQRDATARPLLLKELRQWVIDELDSELVEFNDKGQVIETDDKCNHYGVMGYHHYRKTGRFNWIEIGNDKDSLQSAKLLINPDTHVGEHNPLRGKFKFPQAMLIEATDRCAGDVEMVVKGGKTTTKELKGFGYKYLIFQAILGKDQADNYSAFGHYPEDLGFGDVSAYKVLKPCKTAQEVLQAALDVAANLLPYGAQYKSHKGEQVDVDTLTYLNNYFLTAYMTRSMKDDMDLFKLCKTFKVNTSKVEGNNKFSAPKRVYVGSETHVESLQELLSEIIDVDFKGIKSLKKTDIGERLDKIKSKLESVDFEPHYEMISEEKL